MVDNEEYADRDIEDLPPEIGSIENSIFSCDPHITLKKLQVDLASAGLLDLNSKPEMAVEELENLTVMLLSLNPRKYRMKELNLDDTRLTDDKMRTLAPLIVRFKTVKIGGKQDYGQKGLEELRLYMEQINGLPNIDMDEDVLPVIKSEKIFMRRLEIKQTKSKIGVTDFTWVNEEVKGIENEDEKSLMVNELSNMIPYLNSLVLDGFLRESAAKPVNSIIGKTKENRLWKLWKKLNISQHMEHLSLRDCDLSDRIIVKCVVGLTNIKIVDLSGNNDITHVGWKCLADTMRTQKGKYRLRNLIFQNSKHPIDYQIGEQFTRMFSALQKLDLKKNTLTDDTVKLIAKSFNERELVKLEKLDLTGCSFSKSSHEEFEEINRRNGNIIQFGAFDDMPSTSTGFCPGLVCCKSETN